jgi:hypothetical protein
MSRPSRRSARHSFKSTPSNDKLVNNIKSEMGNEIEETMADSGVMEQEFSYQSDTPTSLNSFPSSVSVDNQISPSPIGEDMVESHEERRKRVHLDCEHRRRRQIADGLFKLSQILPKELPRSSKMEILNSSILAIQLYEQRLANLQVQQLELSGLKQTEDEITINN